MPARATQFDPRVDAYINKARPFAQPILEHIRASFHRAAPQCEESIKWGMPFFLLNGIILGNMAAFKEHCSLGLWGGAMSDMLKAEGIEGSSGMGKFGKVTSVKDLPAKKELDGFIREAARMVLEGERTKSIDRPAAKKAPKPVVVPEALAAALKSNKLAQTNFTAMSASCQREYADWISDAKREATRDSRLAQAIAWISEGKKRNWKYENC